MTAALGKKLTSLGAAKEAFAVWVLAFAAIVAAFVLYRPAAKVIATLSFLYLPLLCMDVRQEEYADYGVTLRRWKQDVALFLLMVALVTPLYLGGYVLFHQLIQAMPRDWARHLSPTQGPLHFELRLPHRFGEWVVDQVFVVALPEEFFYRGFLQTRFTDAWPMGRKFLGARWGKAFWVTQVLFALGHLAIFQFWRLGVFFPSILFGWMRERTGTVLGSTLFHAYCNLLALVLEASFFGRT